MKFFSHCIVISGEGEMAIVTGISTLSRPSIRMISSTISAGIEISVLLKGTFTQISSIAFFLNFKTKRGKNIFYGIGMIIFTAEFFQVMIF